MAVKAFASKWAGPFALLKVFTSFFSEKQKERIKRAVGKSGVQMNHCLPPSLSEPGQPQVRGAENEAQRGWMLISKLDSTCTTICCLTWN